MDEKRGAQRWRTTLPIEALDCASGRLAGAVLDIGADGLRLAGDQPIPPGRVFELEIAGPESRHGAPVTVHALSRWTRFVPDAARHETGFRLLDTTGAQAEAIERLVRGARTA